jgi:hypothetical protein
MLPKGFYSVASTPFYAALQSIASSFGLPGSYAEGAGFTGSPSEGASTRSCGPNSSIQGGSFPRSVYEIAIGLLWACDDSLYPSKGWMANTVYVVGSFSHTARCP